MKSLYIKLYLFRPNPLLTNSNSLFFACTMITSPSQFAAFFRAAPVPTDTTWATISMSDLIIGRI